MILPTLGVMTAWDYGGRRRWVRGLVILSVAASPALTLYDYFVRYPTETKFFDDFQIGYWQLNQAARIAAQEGVSYLMLTDDGAGHFGTRLSAELTQGDLRVLDADKCFAYPTYIEHPTSFAVMNSWVPSVIDQYPNAREEKILNTDSGEVFGSLLTLNGGQTSRLGLAPALAKFGTDLELIGFELESAPRRGDSLKLTLRWRALAKPATRYTAFVHLLDAQQNLVSGMDREPCEGTYNTSQWHRNEVVQYQIAVAAPATLPAGDYEFALGLYDTITQERLPVMQLNQREPDRARVYKFTLR
jgi:hypothetical protein